MEEKRLVMMATTLTIQTGEELLKKIQELTEDQKIFIDVDKSICKDLQFILLQKSGFRNLFLSYLNATREEINLINFKEFWDRYSDLLIKEFDLIRNTAISYMGIECYTYLSDNLRRHNFYIDTERNLIVIHVIGREKFLDGCNCHAIRSIEKI